MYYSNNKYNKFLVITKILKTSTKILFWNVLYFQLSLLQLGRYTLECVKVSRIQFSSKTIVEKGITPPVFIYNNFNYYSLKKIHKMLPCVKP